MSRSATVDRRYRLQPADLRGGARRVTIQGVSFQGLEQLQPVLHFGSTLPKPLVLDMDQVQSVIQITRSVLVEHWVDHTVDLQLVAGVAGRIVISPPTATSPLVSEPPQSLPQPQWASWRTIALVFLLGLALLLVWLVENSDAVWQLLRGQ